MSKQEPPHHVTRRQTAARINNSGEQEATESCSDTVFSSTLYRLTLSCLR